MRGCMPVSRLHAAMYSQLLATLRVNVKDDCVVVAVAVPLLLETPPPQPPNSNISKSTKSRVRQQRRACPQRVPINRKPNGMAANPNQVAK